MSKNNEQKAESAPRKELFRELLEKLERAKEAHDQLLTVVREKKDALINLDYDRLQKTILAEEELLKKITRVENERIRKSIEVAEELDLDPEKVGLKEIANSVPEPFEGELRTLRRRLREIMEEISSLNETNRLLGEQGLERTEDFLNALVGQEDDPGTYSRDGEKDDGDGQKRRLIDHRV